jgi:hypothetical protein
MQSNKKIHEVTHTNDTPTKQLDQDSLIAFDTIEKDGANDDETVTVIMKDATTDPALALHNSFDLLNEDAEIPFRENMLVEHEQTQHNRYAT